MRKLFLTKVWGYNPIDWPILGFSTPGGANKLAAEYHTGDWIVLVGTKSTPTADNDQGRLLGMVQVTNSIIQVEPILKSIGTTIGMEAYKETGDFRWEHGFPFLKALIFNTKPLLHEVLPDRNHQLGRAEAAYALALSHEEAIQIEQLATHEIEITLPPELQTYKKLSSLITQEGPVPSIGDRTSTYVDGINYVYIFRIKGTNFYKIGRTNNIDRRLEEFNTSPHAIWAEKPLEQITSAPFNDAETAHSIEQIIHKNLSEYSMGHECFKINKEAVAKGSIANAMVEFSESN